MNNTKKIIRMCPELTFRASLLAEILEDIFKNNLEESFYQYDEGEYILADDFCVRADEILYIALELDLITLSELTNIEMSFREYQRRLQRKKMQIYC